MFILRYGDLGLILIKQYFPKNTWMYFNDDAICTYFPEKDGITGIFGEGTGQLNSKAYGPGTFHKIRDLTKQGVLLNKRQCYMAKQGYSLCLCTADNRDVDVNFIDQVNPILPANTMALVLGDSVEFVDNNMQKKAQQYNLIDRRQYDMQIIGQSKLLFITV